MKVIDENALKKVDFKKRQRNESNLDLTSLYLFFVCVM